MSDTLQFVVIAREKSLTGTGNKLNCVGHFHQNRFVHDAPVGGAHL